MTQTRLKELLKNAIYLLECTNTAGDTLIGTDLEGELNITQEEYDEIKSTGELHTDIYTVVFDWATQDDSNVEVFIYSDYADALKKYYSVIADETNPELSWVGNEAIGYNGEINDGFELHEQRSVTGKTERYWRVFDNNSIRHSCVSLSIKEIN